MLNIFILMVLYIGIGLPIYLSLSIEKSNWQKVIGNSFFIGVFIVIVFLNLVQLFDININIPMTFFVFSIFSVISLLFTVYVYRQKIKLPSIKNPNSVIQENVYYILATLIVLIHLYHIFSQNTSMPLISWDAWNGWVARAKIWYYHGVSEPIINRFVWLQSESVLTNPIAHYPDGLSLLYLFNSGFLGWNETQLNGIYPAMFISLLLSFYGSIKLLTQSKMYAWMAMIMLVTIPIINIHLVLAGYADIWVAAFLILSVFNVQFFLNKPHLKSFISALIFAIGMVLFKLESWVWLFILTSAFLLSVISQKKRLILYLLFISVCILWLINDGISLSFPFGELIITPELIQIPALGSYELTFLNTTDSLLEALYYSKSWGLLWYFIPLLLILPVFIKDKNLLVLPSLFLVFTALFLFVLFYMTYASNFVNDFTSSNRILMHIVPLYIYLLIQVFNQCQIQRKKNSLIS